jgi:hypothetical protein
LASRSGTPSRIGQADSRLRRSTTSRLNELRETWLNPPDASDAELKKRTLTNVYNARPTWLDQAHQTLDQAIWTAYGWPDEPSETDDETILRRLLAVNLERSAGTPQESAIMNDISGQRPPMLTARS